MGAPLYFRRQEHVLAVSIGVRDGKLDAGPPRILFSGTYAHDLYGDQSYDVAPDGRFLAASGRRGQANGPGGVELDRECTGTTGPGEVSARLAAAFADRHRSASPLSATGHLTGPHDMTRLVR